MILDIGAVVLDVLIVVIVGVIFAGLLVSWREHKWRKWAIENNRRSWLLDILFVTNIIQDAAGLWIASVAIARILELPVPWWFTYITATFVAVLFGKKIWRHRMVVKHADKELREFTQ